MARRSQRGGVAMMIVAALGVVAVVVALVYFFYCPCERVPGGYLLGAQASGEVADWSFANDARLCQIEVDRGLPHSVNLNCMATADGTLYLSCAGCDGKGWSTAALDDPEARIRIGETVYPVVLRRVTDGVELDRAWAARAAKLGRDTGDRPGHWWSFHVASR